MFILGVGNLISIDLNSQRPPVGSYEILTELNIQMVSESNLQDLITEAP